jgi:hypothetical protein
MRPDGDLVSFSATAKHLVHKVAVDICTRTFKPVRAPAILCATANALSSHVGLFVNQVDRRFSRGT